MERTVEDSKHATTSLEGATAAIANVATQMRATLIYLAPFLQPCKNVVTTKTTIATNMTTRASQQHQQQQQQHQQQQPMPQLFCNKKYIANTQQQTHVARNRINSGSNNHNNAINFNSTSSSSSNNNNNNNNNNNIHNNNKCENFTSSGKYCCSDTANKTATKSCGTQSSCGGSSSCNRDGYITTSTSCCHNITQQQLDEEENQQRFKSPQQQQQEQEEEQAKEQNIQHKDIYYENFEMPALESTTTIKTTTTTKQPATLHVSNNKLEQQLQQHQQQQEQKETLLVKNDEEQGISSLLSTLPSSSPSSSTSFSCSLSTSFVYHTNNRITKHFRERGRKNILQQQQKQTLKQTYGRTLKQDKQRQELLLQKQTPPSLRLCLKQQQQQHTLVQQAVLHQKVVENERQLQRNLTCGRNPYDTKDHANIKSNNTSVLSRCHSINYHQHNNIMHSNVQDMEQQHENMGSMSFQSCDDLLDNSNYEKTDYDVGDDDNDVTKTAQLDNEVVKANIHLRLSRSHKQAMVTHKNSYVNCNDFLGSKATTTSLTSFPSSSQSASYLTPPSSSLSVATSYTTTLSKDCRCFICKSDIIGSECECNKNRKNSDVIKALESSSSSPHNDTYYSINVGKDEGIAEFAVYNNPSSLLLSNKKTLCLTNASQLQWHCRQWQCQWSAALFGCSKLTKMVAVSKWLFMWLLFLMLTSPANCWTGRNDVPTNCTFPARWEGSWFLSGYQQSIHIKGSQFSYRGRCAASDGNKYLIVDEKGCHRCLVIYEKHNNVLQYKESECEGDSMYMHQTNPSAMAMRSVLNQKTNNNGGDHRGGAHPNLNGHSRLSSSDQYIMRSNDDMNDCPPDFCKGRETLQNLCDQIPGDALLYSLFRESAEPVKCPLKGPFIFTYNRGNGECKNPVSNIESCTEDSRLLLSFQACPDVVGTESTVEELTCLATWKDGNSRYLVGLVSHHHAISNEERYRCFVYEKISSLMDLGHFGGPSMTTSKDAEYKLAQSGDATCNGLDSAEVGSRIMSLRKPPVTERCDFPVWFKGPRHWHVLMGNAVYNYHTNDGSIHIIKPNGYMETRALCEQINKQTSTEMMSVVHYTTGCQSGFMCMMFYRRDTHVIEIQTGRPASRLEDACAPDHFDIIKTPYITLLASNPDPQICPMEGLYSLRGAIGPPYLATRHKRNHNKMHGLHNHHHQYEGNLGREYLHKRHSSLSFRNSNHDGMSAWHSNTRGLPVRSRRDASSTVKPLATMTSNQTPFTKTTQEILVVGNSTNVDFVQDSNSDTRLRSRRNVPECVSNYKAQRRLWIGCTEPNIIDVRPLCSEEGDEEYSCHGSWSENGTVYIIARHKGTKHGVCISYRPTEGPSAKLVVGDACYRGIEKPPEHHLVANLTVFGKCGETGSASATMPIVSWFNIFLATIFITFLHKLPIQR